jgi:hypothetical protein
MTLDERLRLIELLEECEEYFESRADAWTEDGRWVQNEENRLHKRVCDALGEIRTLRDMMETRR